MQASWRQGVRRTATTAAACCAAALAGAGTASAAPPWLTPSDLAAPQAGFPVGNPQVGVGDDGSAVAVFAQRPGTVTRVYASARPAGGAFGTALPISDDSQSASSLRVGVDPQGNATAVWQLGTVVQAAYRPAGGGWGPPQPLSGPDGNTPQLAVGPGGGAVVAWYNNVAAASQRAMVAARAPGAASFGAAQAASPLTAQGPSGVYPPRAAIDAAGNVMAIWQRNVDVGGGTSRNVIESAYKPAGSPFPGTAETRSSTAGNTSSDVSIAMAAGGRVFAAWSFTEGADPPRLEYAERAPGASFGPRTVLSGPPGVGASTPKVALNDGGTVAVTWSQGNAVMSTVRNPGGAFSPGKALSGPGASSFSSAIDLAPNGEAVIAWPTSSPSEYAEFSARRRPGGESFGEVTEIARGTSATPPTVLGAPALGLDGEGDGVVVWQRQSGTGPVSYTPQASAYDVTPPVLTGVAVPGTATAGSAVDLSATASDRVGPVAFAWDFGDGATAAGATVSHAFGAPGVSTVRVVATDAAGNSAESTRAIQVVAAPPSPPPAGPPVGDADADGDGSPARLDCNDRDPKIRPGATEVRGNAVDENCDGRAEAFPVVGASATLRVDRLRNGRTRIRSLRVTGLAKGDVVALSCATTKRGCRKAATRRVTAKRTSVSFDPQVAGMSLAPKATLVVRVTRRGATARIVTYTMVRRKAPQRRTRCLAPGAKAATACG